MGHQASYFGGMLMTELVNSVMFSSAVWLTWKRGRTSFTITSGVRAVPLADLGATSAGPYERM